MSFTHLLLYMWGKGFCYKSGMSSRSHYQLGVEWDKYCPYLQSNPASPLHSLLPYYCTVPTYDTESCTPDIVLPFITLQNLVSMRSKIETYVSYMYLHINKILIAPVRHRKLN